MIVTASTTTSTAISTAMINVTSISPMSLAFKGLSTTLLSTLGSSVVVTVLGGVVVLGGVILDVVEGNCGGQCGSLKVSRIVLQSLSGKRREVSTIIEA